MDYLKVYVEKNNLTIKTENVNKKYLCSICDNILINPKISNCSCTYCEACIDSYIEIGGCHCPSCESDVDITSNVYPDTNMRAQILELLIECPHISCNKKVLIKSMKKHLEKCNGKILQKGTSFGASKEGKPQHLDDQLAIIVKDISKHSVIIDAIKNEAAKNEKKLEELDQVVVVNLKSELEKLKIEIDKEVESFKENVDVPKPDVNNLKSHRGNFKNDLVKLKEDLTKNSDKLSALKCEKQILNIDVNKCTKRTVEMENKNAELTKHLEKLKKEALKNLEYKEPIFDICQQHECTLKFDRFCRKNTKVHYSKIFSLRHYSFRIRMRIIPYDEIHDVCWMYFYVLSISNEYSRALDWPIPFQLKIQLMALNNQIVHNYTFGHDKSKFKSDFIMPKEVPIRLRDSEIKYPYKDLGQSCLIKLCAVDD